MFLLVFFLSIPPYFPLPFFVVFVVFLFEEWPKSGIPDVAIIGYPSNSTAETAPGRHLIGQRRPLPDPGNILTGCARFWLFNSRRVPDSHALYPITATNTRAHRPTAHTRTIPGSCSQLSTTTASFQIDSLQDSRVLELLLLREGRRLRDTT